jgi:hypothetical protein
MALALRFPRLALFLYRKRSPAQFPLAGLFRILGPVQRSTLRKPIPMPFPAIRRPTLAGCSGSVLSGGGRFSGLKVGALDGMGLFRRYRPL